MSQTSESRCAGMLRPNGHARHGKPFTMIFDDAFFLDYSEEAISEASRSKDIEDYNSALDRVEKERDQQSEEIDRLTAENVHLREERRKALSGYSDEIDRLKKEIADLSDMRDVLDTYRYNEEIRVAQVRDLTADLAAVTKQRDVLFKACVAEINRPIILKAIEDIQVMYLNEDEIKYYADLEAIAAIETGGQNG